MKKCNNCQPIRGTKKILYCRTCLTEKVESARKQKNKFFDMCRRTPNYFTHLEYTAAQIKFNRLSKKLLKCEPAN